MRKTNGFEYLMDFIFRLGGRQRLRLVRALPARVPADQQLRRLRDDPSSRAATGSSTARSSARGTTAEAAYEQKHRRLERDSERDEETDEADAQITATTSRRAATDDAEPTTSRAPTSPTIEVEPGQPTPDPDAVPETDAEPEVEVAPGGETTTPDERSRRPSGCAPRVSCWSSWSAAEAGDEAAQPELRAGSSPTMVGAITVLIAILAVFLAYNANNGLPFVPTYRISVELPNADRSSPATRSASAASASA